MRQLVSPRCVIDIDPDAGGRIAQISVDGAPQLIGHSETDDPVFGWGSYPMVPWAGRIRHGRFNFDGTDYQLDVNMCPHAIHGVAYDVGWDVVNAGETHASAEIEMVCDLDPRRWPLGGTSRQRLTLGEQGDQVQLTQLLSVTAAERSMPVAIGWHPWFRKPERLDFRPDRQYVRDSEWITTADTTPPRPGPWDDTFINHHPVTLHYADRMIEVASELATWVVFDEPPHSTCVEPQTAPPDAFNTAPTVLAAGATLEATMTTRWRSRR